jgi:hypothetical protein
MAKQQRDSNGKFMSKEGHMSDEQFHAEMTEMAQTAERITQAMAHDDQQFGDDLDEICELADKIVVEVRAARQEENADALHAALARVQAKPEILAW